MKKSVTDVKKEKQGKGDFLVKSSNILITIRNVLHYLVLFLTFKTSIKSNSFIQICFFNFQSCECDQPSHNHIKHDLCNLNFSYTCSYM